MALDLRRFKFQDQDGEHIITAELIREIFFPYWRGKMMDAGKPISMITFENCLDDWIVTHWAWEIKDEKDGNRL